MISLPDTDLFLYTTVAALSCLLCSYPDTYALSLYRAVTAQWNNFLAYFWQPSQAPDYF